MSIESFIKAARDFYPEVDEYFAARPELVVALTNDAVSIDKIFQIVPSLVAILDRHGLTRKLQEAFFLRDKDFAKTPSSLRLLAQVFGHPWQHVNLEKALADAVAATRINLGLDDPECKKAGECGDCECEQGEDEPISVGLTPEGDLAYVVSGEPLTLQEEAKFIDTLRGESAPIPLNMWAAAAGFSLEDIKQRRSPAAVENSVAEVIKAEHDPVNKPKHYTTHPSGVECIELSEKLSFNLGNAFKYVFRRDDKENSLQDVSKAEWYLKREIVRLENLIENSPASTLVFIHPALTVADLRKADKVIAAEKNSNAADFYAYLFSQGPIQEPDDLAVLHDALNSLQALIEDVRNSFAEPEEV